MYLTRPPNYDKTPCVDVPGHGCAVGWDKLAMVLRDALSTKNGTVLAVDCYPGTDEAGIAAELTRQLKPSEVVMTSAALRPPAGIERLIEPYLGGNDPVFGFMCPLELEQFFDPEKLAGLRDQVRRRTDDGIIMVVGVGATLAVRHPDVLVLADLARWEAQLRFRRNASANLGSKDPTVPASLQYKRAFFVDWRVADRHKKPLLASCDFVLDTHLAVKPKLATGVAVREGLKRASSRPFRVVPFFDPAPWGGQWMKEVCGLDPAPANYGWCFDCVPEENSLYLGLGEVRNFELPSLDVVFQHPRELLGDRVQARFGAEFPIRFDFLDTMAGGNLSLQVHPLTDYIQKTFGMQYTQDESYYMLDAGPEAGVYLGVKTGINPAEMIAALERAQVDPAQPFPASRFVNWWPAKKHDHFLIPAGTVHCSGSNAMVLEISATPYIFTFKLWDWGRLGLDGKPRPIHINHGRQVIQFDRDTEWTKRELVNHIEPVGSGDGWTEERTGLHEREFIETRRHWFTKTVPHHTGGDVNVLNLIEGEEAVVESPAGTFDPFVAHYAETFIVPASVGAYTVRPTGRAIGTPCGTLKAFVRHGA